MQVLQSFLVLILIQLQNSINVNGQLKFNNNDDDDCCEEYCYSDYKGDYKSNIHYSTKTSYDFLKLNESEIRKSINVPSDCKPTKLWILSRHGTRLPDSDFINEMTKLTGIKNEILRNYDNRTVKISKGRLCKPDYLNIKLWALNTTIKPSMSNDLVPQGFNELRRLGLLYRAVFPEIFNRQYDSELFTFSSSKTKRTKDSLSAFATGIFGVSDKTNPVLTRALNDSFIRPHEACNLWMEQHNNDKEDNESEINKFEVSELLNRTVLNISKRLGFTSYFLQNKIVDLIWDMCRYEQAWNVNRLSAWCAAFTPTQNQILEYKEDLKYYYKFGYGHDLNTRLACYTVQDMLKHLENNNNPLVKTYFSHSALIQSFLAALGAFKDNQPLKSDNINDMKNRLWQTSSISPFTSNIVVAKYDCPPGSENDPKILFLLNERPLDVEGCKSGLCDLSYLITKYEQFYTANCHDYFCSSTGYKSILLSNFITLTLIISLIYLFNY